MANEFKIKYGAIIEGAVQVVSGNITLSDLATIDGMDPSVHILNNNGSAHHTATTSLNGFMSSGDKTKLEGLQNYTHPNHTGDVTSTGDGATVIASGVIDDDNIATGANIALAKLANGTKILLNNGDITMAANFDMSTGGTKYRIINLGAPTNADDAATKAYVDAAVSGFNLKDPVALATTTNVTLSGEQYIDGTLTNTTRLLVKDNTDKSENGIWVTATGAWTRATDADATSEVTIGMTVFVEGGTTNANSSWALSAASASPIIIDDTELTFTLFARTGEIIAGNGLTKTGNTIDVVGTTDRITVGANSIDIASTYVGQTSITTLGTIGTGTWNATAIAANKGGTGQTSYTVGDILYASGSAALSKLAGVATGNVLISGGVGTAPSWGKVGLTTHISGTLAIANGGTAATSASAAFNNLSPMTKLGDIIYGGDSGAGTALPGNTDTTTKFLASTGDGTRAAAPVWRSLSVSHISDLNSTISTALSTYTGSATIATVGTITSGTWASSTVIAGAYGGTGVANTGKTITISGNVSIGSSTNTVTLTTSGTTNVALPTGGTLATIAGTETLLNKTLTSPVLTTPTLGIPASGTLTNCTGLPIATGINGLATGIANFLATPSSANLALAVTDETGSGSLVFSVSPTFTGTPVAPTAAVDTNTTQIATTAFVVGQGYIKANQTITLSGDVTGSGTTAITATIANDAVKYGMLHDNVISGQTALASGLEATDELLVSDAGTLKKMAISVLGTYLEGSFVKLSGGTLSGSINMGNNEISGVSVLTLSSTSPAATSQTYLKAYSHTNTNTINLITVAASSVDAIFFDYVVKTDSGTALRAGTFVVTHAGTSALTKSHYTTDDAGTSTDTYELDATISGSNIIITGKADNGWTIKGYVRTL